MRTTRAFLVLADISGYTRFITERSLTLAHAERVITELIEAVLDQVRVPMVVNKLEGDAALLFREIEADDVAGARDVLAQVRGFFPAFSRRLAALRAECGHCSCDACSNVADLRLKAFVNVGEIAVKQVRQFEELAGEPVIFVHRLMKNGVQRSEYVLMTEAAREAAQLAPAGLAGHGEHVAGFGRIDLWVADPDALPEPGAEIRQPATRTAPVQRSASFHHLPRPAPALWRRLRHWLGGAPAA